MILDIIPNNINIMWKTFKQLRNYWSFFYYCYNWGPWPKAEWVYENKIKSIAQEHPILNFITSII